MTDFKGFNPDKNLGANFNANRQGKNAKPNANLPQGDNLPAGDPYAGQKLDPDRMMDLLAAQAKLNIPSQVENPGIERSIEAFTQQIPPERHARVSNLLQQVYTDEFGALPGADILQNMVDDYLIGHVSVQNT